MQLENTNLASISVIDFFICQTNHGTFFYSKKVYRSTRTCSTQLIFKRLPLWKIHQLSSLHSRLNKIKREVFRNQIQLRLLAGCRTTRHYVGRLKKIIHSLDVDDQNENGFAFDLLLKFDNSNENSLNYNAIRDDQEIEISHDIFVRNLDQITGMAQMFPSLKKLTIVFTNECERQSLGQLMRNWPKLTHLYFVDFQHDEEEDSLDYENVLIEINNLHDLQVLAVYYSDYGRLSTRNWPLEVLEPLLQNATQLHTLYFRDGPYVRRNCRHSVDYKNHWSQRVNGEQLRVPFERIERFGLVDYNTDSGIFREERLLKKITRLEMYIIPLFFFFELPDPFNWSALQFLSLSWFLHFNLNHLFRCFVGLHNLHELRLLFDDFGNIHGSVRFPLESVARRLPQLPSIRRFELCSVTSPHHLYRLKWALPNVDQLRFRLFFSLDFTNFDSLTSFCAQRRFVYYQTNVLPESCIEDMKRAFVSYGSEIQNFYWVYYRNGRKDDGQAELVPLVERYTKIISGMRRANFDLEEIEY